MLVSSPHPKEKLLAIFLVTCIALYIFFIAFNRQFLTFDVESDYLWQFVPEAKRVLAGEPLQLEFHPPFYSIVLAFFYTFIRDWFAVGLTISWLSAIVALVANFFFFYQLLGRYSAWGAVFGLISASNFLIFAATASSDMFFFALYSSVLFLSILATRSNSPKLWAICGLFVGCLLLSRSNGVTMILITLAPWLYGQSFKDKLTNFLCLVAGILAPLMAWALLAVVSDSQLATANNHLNFAIAYYSSDRHSIEALNEVSKKFENLLEVLSYDPVFIIKTYLNDLGRFFKEILKILELPLFILIPPGLFLILKRSNKEIILYFWIISLSQILLLNFKLYSPRYFLFLVPFFGAGIFELFHRGLASAKEKNIRNVLMISFVVASSIAIMISLTTPWDQLHRNDAELKEITTLVNPLQIHDAVVIARKPHIPFYLDSEWIFFPESNSLNDLQVFLASQPKQHSLFVYYGSSEKQRRKKLADLVKPEIRPEWLEVVAKSAEPEQWVLYRYEPIG